MDDPVQPQVVRVLWIGLVVDPHHRVHALAALPVAEHLDRRPRSDEAFHARTIAQQDLDPGLVLELSGPRLDAPAPVLCGCDVFGDPGPGGPLRQPPPPTLPPPPHTPGPPAS